MHVPIEHCSRENKYLTSKFVDANAVQYPNTMMVLIKPEKVTQRQLIFPVPREQISLKYNDRTKPQTTEAQNLNRLNMLTKYPQQELHIINP